MTDDSLEVLRANLARHTKKARTRPLVELGQALADRYWRVGPRSPEGGPYLDEAIEVTDEAYGHLEPGEFLRGQVAGRLGWLIGFRHMMHGSPESDRERGIDLLEEALTFPQQPQIIQSCVRFTLGQLLLSRVTRTMQSGDFAMRAMRAGLSREEMATADRAVACFREILDGPASSAEITSLARTMLGVAEAAQTLAGGLGGGPGGLDLGRMMQALAALQNAQQQAAARPAGVGLGRMPNFFDFDADTIANADPLERPVAVVDGTRPDAPTPPRPRPQAAPRVPAATLRKALLDKLPGPDDLAGVLAMLDEGATPPGVDTVDELVALGSSLVEAPGAAGTDHLLLAVALHLRGVVDDGGGWGDGGADDVRAEGDSLLAAAGALAAAPADTVAVAFRLATLLDERLPGRDIRTRLGEGFATVTEALRTVGADGLVYPASGEMLLLSSATGRISYAASGSGLPARVLVAGAGPIPGEPTVSYVGSGAQVLELAGRTRLPLTGSAVFVTNPRHDRKQATFDAMALRRTFYPRSTGLGETAENVDGAGTPDEVRTRLNASMLHLGCGVSVEGGLELAGPDVLGPAEIAAGTPAEVGGLAVLPPTATGAAALTEALLASRFVGVIGFREPVPDLIASLMYFLLHAHLVDEGRDPASAVKAVRSWMADPHRKPPDHLPAWCEAMAADPDMDDPAYWGPLIHSGV
jgi:hypothetical protein